MTNSADPDQLALKKPTDLDLHCLLRQGMSFMFSKRKVKFPLLFYFQLLDLAEYRRDRKVSMNRE